ncbi:MAG TPA: hypothetical protein VLJ76_05020 [Gaiellaceae bacterium]|nr:hypothetical protein [Gaiellaceae bacterium]
MPDEAPELSVTERSRRLAGRNLEVVEVPRHLVAFRGTLDADVEHPGGAAVEALLDRPHTPRPHHLHQTGLGEHLDVVGDRALRPLESGCQLGHRRGSLVEEAEDRRAEGMADRLDLGRPGERNPVSELVVGGSRVAAHGANRLTSQNVPT